MSQLPELPREVARLIKEHPRRKEVPTKISKDELDPKVCFKTIFYNQMLKSSVSQHQSFDSFRPSDRNVSVLPPQTGLWAKMCCGQRLWYERSLLCPTFSFAKSKLVCCNDPL